MTENRSRVHKFQPGDSWSWSEVKKEHYKAGEGSWCGIDRNTIVGTRGEDAAFHLRYFEIEPGGNSSLEKHVHEHVVICARGVGRAIVGAEIHDLCPMDVVYIAPDVPHQLLNPGPEPFGFFCIVDAERDRPRELSVAEIAELDAREETRGAYRK